VSEFSGFVEDKEKTVPHPCHSLIVTRMGSHNSESPPGGMCWGRTVGRGFIPGTSSIKKDTGFSP